MVQTAEPEAPHTIASTSISIEKLAKVFSKRGEVTRAVDGVDLEIKPGELFFLLGPSGCGKTTLLRMLAGFIDPNEGSIRFNTRDVTHEPPEKRNTGMVFQSYALWPHMTVEQNVAFGLGVRKVAPDEKKRRVAEALETVQMGRYAQRKPNELSGGQQQRIALARALVIRPEVLLLDEPLSNLDAKLRIELRSQIRSVCKSSSITTVYVTHDQKEALSMADRMAVLRDGQVVQVGSPEELYRRPGSAFVASFLGETNFLPAAVHAIDDEAILLKSEAGIIKADNKQMKTLDIELAEGSPVTCSLRPEAGRIVGATESNSLHANYLETIYLGEVAHHVVELPGVGRAQFAELNPQGVGSRFKAGDSIGVRFDPDDVVILPAN